jgi:hypothetical protein
MSDPDVCVCLCVCVGVHNTTAIQAKLDAGEKPTPQIISLILKDQTGKAQGLLRKDSSLICHAICVNAFASIGWDFNKNCGCVRASLGLVAGLSFRSVGRSID